MFSWIEKYCRVLKVDTTAKTFIEYSNTLLNYGLVVRNSVHEIRDGDILLNVYYEEEQQPCIAKYEYCEILRDGYGLNIMRWNGGLRPLDRRTYQIQIKYDKKYSYYDHDYDREFSFLDSKPLIKEKRIFGCKCKTIGTKDFIDFVQALNVNPNYSYEFVTKESDINEKNCYYIMRTNDCCTLKLILKKIDSSYLGRFQLQDYNYKRERDTQEAIDDKRIVKFFDFKHPPAKFEGVVPFKNPTSAPANP